MEAGKKKIEIEKVKLKRHGILEKIKHPEECLRFKSENVIQEYGELDLLYVLDELSIDGWELLCYAEGQYILRTVEYVEDEIKYHHFEFDED